MRTEQELIDSMQEILQAKMQKDYQKGKVRRDAHPKTLGLLKAEFKIMEDIPKAYKQGVFASVRKYDAWLRFSNASGKIQSDKKKDFRGIGIKLMGVEGERYGDTEQQTQDFLLMTHPTMPLGTVKLFHDAVYYATKNPLLLVFKFLFTGKGHILKALAKGKAFDSSPLDINYWSTTPYAYGNKQVKYKIVPRSNYKSQLPKPLTDNYLRDNMSEHLSKDSAQFDFYVQAFKDEQSTPIEDAGVEWKEADSPFVKVAEINIPKQKFDTEERAKQAEEFTFSPANSLEAHKPVGGINRARIQIYTALSKFRHHDNKMKLVEPK